MLTTRYYWIVDDYFEGGWRNSSHGILYHGSEIEHEKATDLKAPLLLHVFETSFEKVWSKMFWPNDKDKEVSLSVHGSLFVEMIFEAYVRYRRTTENSGSFVCAKKLEASHINVLTGTFKERVDRLLGLMGENKKQYTCEVKVDIGFTENTELSNNIVERLNKCDFTELFKVVFRCPDNNNDDADVRIVLGKSEEDIKNKEWDAFRASDNVFFVCNSELEGQFNNSLNPRCDVGRKQIYCWKFTNENTLCEILKQYIESYVLAQRFTRICREFGESSLYSMSTGEQLYLYSLTKVLPFAIVEFPESVIVEEKVALRIISFGIDDDNLPRLDTDNIKLEYDSEGEVNGVKWKKYEGWSSSLDAIRLNISRPSQEYDLTLIKIGEISKYKVVNEHDVEDVVYVKNHNKTTGCEISVNGDRCYEYDMAVGGTIDVSVRGTNRYEKANTPIDANSWTYELEHYDDVECKPSDGVECKVHEKNGCRTLSVLSNASGKFYLRFLWDGKRIGSCFIRMKPRVERLDCELEPIEIKLPVEIRRFDNGMIEVECFRGQEIEFAAKAIADGCSYPDDIYNPEFVFKYNGNSEVSCSDGQFKQVLHFRKAGKKLLKFQSCDKVANKATIINVNVKENKSDVMLVSMISGVVLAWFFFFLNYGIGLWTFLAYLIPAGVMYWYRRMRYPQYTKTMFCLVGVDLIMLLWSIMQEIS